ncbi:F-box/kelch-repeat protein At3g23880-like [Apium graveolens]|uniref:F-box/kelch-repeat protein At3g23880-like n=1 Tax=Apium graveolens TaxID=4045 RepID=UPI003D7C0797
MNLQTEIVADILSRIPIKSIFHCKCVCKTWHDLLSEPYFVNLHLPRSPAGLIIHRSNYPQETDILKLVELDGESDHHNIHHNPLTRFDLGLGFNYDALLLCETVNGLICLWNYYGVAGYICNPITREYILIPDQKYDSPYAIVTCGFGYVEASDEYKVVRLYMHMKTGKSECKIYTLGTGVWRSLGHLPFPLISFQNGIYLNGNLHWLTTDPEGTPNEMVCTFDLEKELFLLTPAAPFVVGRDVKDRIRYLGTLGECLCICDSTADFELSIWVMKDYEMKEMWSKEIVIREPSLQYQNVRPLIFLESGCILMVCLDRFLFTYCPEYGTVQIIEDAPKKAFDARVYVPSFIRLGSFVLENVFVF